MLRKQPQCENSQHLGFVFQRDPWVKMKWYFYVGLCCMYWIAIFINQVLLLRVWDYYVLFFVHNNF